MFHACTSLFCFRHGDDKRGNISGFLSKVIPPEICLCKPDSLFSRSSPQPPGSEFDIHLNFSFPWTVSHACTVFPLKVDVRVENAEPLLRNLFGHQSHTSDGESVAPSQKHVQSGRTRRKTDESHRAEKEKCLSSTSNFVEQARAMVSSLLGQRSGEFGQWPSTVSLDYRLLEQCWYLP